MYLLAIFQCSKCPDKTSNHIYCSVISVLVLSYLVVPVPGSVCFLQIVWVPSSGDFRKSPQFPTIRQAGVPRVTKIVIKTHQEVFHVWIGWITEWNVPDYGSRLWLFLFLRNDRLCFIVCVNLCEKERLTTHGRQSSCLCVAGTHKKNMNAEYMLGYYTGVLQACRHSTPTQIQSPGSFIRRWQVPLTDQEWSVSIITSAGSHLNDKSPLSVKKRTPIRKWAQYSGVLHPIYISRP